MSTRKPSRLLVHMTEDDLRQLVEQAAERGAARVLASQKPLGLNSAEAARLLGKSPAAFKQFLARHPDFPREKAGKRLLFEETRIKAWLAAPRGKGGRKAG